MTDYSNSVSEIDGAYVPKTSTAFAPEIKTTVYGIDSAIIMVLLAALSFWACIGAAAWFFL